MNVPYYLQSLVKTFLVDRQQYVRVFNSYSSTLNCDEGCPLSCFLSSVLFSIYTDFIKSSSDKVNIFKYTDDMAIVGFLDFEDHSTLYPYFLIRPEFC